MIINKEKAQQLGITSMPPYISSEELGVHKGVGCRAGVTNILFWFDIIELDNGEFRHRDRPDLLGKSVNEVISM